MEKQVINPPFTRGSSQLQTDKTNSQSQSAILIPAEDQDKFPGYPPYPATEDAYNAGEIVPLVEEGDIIHNGEGLDPEAWNERADFTGDDLDVPGSELDDDEEQIGSEDEENNYYSLGGDNHEAQEENQGD